MTIPRLIAASALCASPLIAQTTSDPFPDPIGASSEPIRVGFEEFATVPDFDGQAPRLMHMVDEPGTGRLFVSDMFGLLYTVSYDGRTVREYLNLDDPRWAVGVQNRRSELGFQSFAIHPQFAEAGAPGHGKIYVWTDIQDTGPEPDFRPGGGQDSHDLVLFEFTARDARAATYDGAAPRELMRLEQPFGNHNGGQLAFNPLARPGDADFGMLYVGVADGGSGGDPMNLAQNLGSAFGKIFRIDPLGSNSANGEYGIPADNPFVGRSGALGEIYAYGVRNPQRFAWDPANGTMYFSDIGQGTVEEVSPVPSGANLGWNVWEGSFRFASRSEVDVARPRSDRSVTYPVAEYDQTDALLQRSSAASGLCVYRGTEIPQLAGMLVFADNPSGEIMTVSADDPPQGGQDAIRRVLLRDGGEAKTLLQLIRETNEEQGREPASRADLRLGSGPDSQVFLLNKRDGVIRRLTR